MTGSSAHLTIAITHLCNKNNNGSANTLRRSATAIENVRRLRGKERAGVVWCGVVWCMACVPCQMAYGSLQSTLSASAVILCTVHNSCIPVGLHVRSTTPPTFPVGVHRAESALGHCPSTQDTSEPLG